MLAAQVTHTVKAARQQEQCLLVQVRINWRFIRKLLYDSIIKFNNAQFGLCSTLSLCTPRLSMMHPANLDTAFIWLWQKIENKKYKFTKMFSTAVFNFPQLHFDLNGFEHKVATENTDVWFCLQMLFHMSPSCVCSIYSYGKKSIVNQIFHMYV